MAKRPMPGVMISEPGAWPLMTEKDDRITVWLGESLDDLLYGETFETLKDARDYAAEIVRERRKNPRYKKR